MKINRNKKYTSELSLKRTYMASNPPYVSNPGIFVTLVTKAVFTVTNV